MPAFFPYRLKSLPQFRHCIGIALTLHDHPSLIIASQPIGPTFNIVTPFCARQRMTCKKNRSPVLPHIQAEQPNLAQINRRDFERY